MTARQYGKLPIRNWRDENWTAMSALAQWLYGYLESQSSTNSAGVFPVQVSKWTKAAADVIPGVPITKDVMAVVAKQLVGRRYIVVDHDTEEGVLRTHIRDDKAGENVFKGALDIAAQTQSAKLRAVLLREVRSLDRSFSTRELELIDALEASIPAGFDFSSVAMTGTATPTGLNPAVQTASERRSNAVRPDCENCGRHPVMERGLCSACLGRELAQ